MLELKRIQENPGELEEMLARRRFSGIDTAQFRKLIDRSRDAKHEIDAMRSERNTASKEIGGLIRQGQKEQAEKRKASVKHLGDKIAGLEHKYEQFDAEMQDVILALPNYLDADVPDGKDDSENVLIRTHGERPTFDFKPKPHWELGENLNILDFERGVKLAGSRFYTYRGFGARLERALLNYMLDLQVGKFGYTEIWTPALINDAGMLTTGQFPKFKGEYYTLEQDGLSLIPTSEIPLVNLHRDEIIPEEDLPVRVAAAASCFRREAGAAGRDTRGLVRVHQFQKVEIVQFVHPDKSEQVHEEMLAQAEEPLRRLGLHYRVVRLCSGDTGQAAASTYDLEVWLPGLNRYQEISSVSNCRDYQARRGLIRYRAAGPKHKPAYVHTLNGSALAAGRALVAVLENYQQADGRIAVPEILAPYMNRPNMMAEAKI